MLTIRKYPIIDDKCFLPEHCEILGVEEVRESKVHSVYGYLSQLIGQTYINALVNTDSDPVERHFTILYEGEEISFGRNEHHYWGKAGDGHIYEII